MAFPSRGQLWPALTAPSGGIPDLLFWSHVAPMDHCARAELGHIPGAARRIRDCGNAARLRLGVLVRRRSLAGSIYRCCDPCRGGTCRRRRILRGYCRSDSYNPDAPSIRPARSFAGAFLYHRSQIDEFKNAVSSLRPRAVIEAGPEPEREQLRAAVGAETRGPIYESQDGSWGNESGVC